MSDEKKDIKKLREQRTVESLKALSALKTLKNGDSPWTLTQEILQDIMAGHIVANPEKMPKTTHLRKQLIEVINETYKDEEEIKDILLKSVPSVITMRKWIKKSSWQDAVWTKIRGDKLFSPAKRAQMIEALRMRGMETSDSAAKIWLTISGDYSEKVDVSDKTLDKYREINKLLHRKKD